MHAKMAVIKVEEALKLLDMVMICNRSTYSWPEAGLADRDLTAAVCRLNATIGSLKQYSEHTQNVFLIDEMICLMTKGACRDMIASANLQMQRSGITQPRAVRAAFLWWWSNTFSTPIKDVIEVAGLKRLDAYIEEEREKEKEELENLLRLHS